MRNNAKKNTELDKQVTSTKRSITKTSAPKDYAKILENLKIDIRQTQLKAALSVTKEITLLYWRIGKMLSEKIHHEGWGAKTIDRLAHDLENAFPGVSGFSIRNLKYMRKFAEMYSSDNCATALRRLSICLAS